MIQTFANGSIEWFVDQSRRILFSRWSGEFTGDQLLAVQPAFWGPHPEAARYGAVHDNLDFTGIIEHRYSRDLMRLRIERFGAEIPGTRTALVTSDPMKIFDLKVTAIQAPGERLFRMFGSNAAALDWVTAAEPGNPSAGLGKSSNALPWWFHRSSASCLPAGS